MQFSTCLHQVVLFIRKQDYSLVKVFEIYSIGSKCPISHKISNARGIKTSQLGCKGCTIHGRHPLRQDNMGKKCRVPFVYAFWIPENYRPITCLPTTLKNLTSIITDRLHNHLERKNIMAIEQRGGKKDCYRCKNKLMINNTILGNCRERKKNLSTVWIDFKKAFHSVQHSWIIKCMTLYKVHPMTINYIRPSMTRWKTNMTLFTNKEF